MGIYQHFRKEEHPFIDQVLSWKEDVEKTYRYKLTDFLDPREQQIVTSIIGTTNDDLQLVSFGGGKHSERKRMIIAPFYEKITDEMFMITLKQATYNDKFISLSHRDVMGAFLSLGITREKLGDIFVASGTLQIIMAKEISPFVKINLTTVKNANITLEQKPFTALIELEQNWIESEKIVSSLRLDVVLKEIYHVSRKEAANYILRKQVKVNFKIVDQVNFTLIEGDLLSVGGKGRSKLLKIHRRTRKNRLRITTAILK